MRIFHPSEQTSRVFDTFRGCVGVDGNHQYASTWSVPCASTEPRGSVTCGPRYRDEGIEADTGEEDREVCSHTKAFMAYQLVIPGESVKTDSGIEEFGAHRRA